MSVLRGEDGRARCGWARGFDAYVAYHDTEWGVPVHDDRALLRDADPRGRAGRALVVDDPQQARGLPPGVRPASIRRRSRAYDRRRSRALLADAGIVRNRLKVDGGGRQRARVPRACREEFGSFDAYVWGFVDGQPVREPLRARCATMPPRTDAVRRAEQGPEEARLHASSARRSSTRSCRRRGWSTITSRAASCAARRRLRRRRAARSAGGASGRLSRPCAAGGRTAPRPACRIAGRRANRRAPPGCRPARARATIASQSARWSARQHASGSVPGRNRPARATGQSPPREAVGARVDHTRTTSGSSTNACDRQSASMRLHHARPHRQRHAGGRRARARAAGRSRTHTPAASSGVKPRTTRPCSRSSCRSCRRPGGRSRTPQRSGDEMPNVTTFSSSMRVSVATARRQHAHRRRRRRAAGRGRAASTAARTGRGSWRRPPLANDAVGAGRARASVTSFVPRPMTAPA